MANLSSITLPNGNTYNFKTYTNNIEYQKSSASGSIAHFEDGSDSDAVDVVAHIEPLQDLHGYDNPWPAGGGKNLLNADGYVLQTEAGVDRTASLPYQTYLEAGQSYTFSCRQIGNAGTVTRNILGIAKTSASSVSIAWETSNTGDAHVHQVTYTPSESGYYVLIYWTHTLTNAVTLDQWQVEKGSSFTSYAPYSNICPISGFTGMNISVSDEDMTDPTVYPITFPQEAGTVYGGYVDVTRGKLVVDRASVEYDGSSDEQWGEYGIGSANYCCVSYPSGKVVGYQKSICNEFKNQNSAFGSSDFGKYSDHPSLTNTYFRMPNSEVNTRSEFLAWIAQNPIQLCYELATPITYDLTPQQIELLLGVNNVWNDCNGDTDVEYIPYWMQKLVYDVLSPLSSFHTTVGDGSLTSFTIAHYLNTKNILVSVNITDNNVTYIAPLTNLTSSGQIGYSVIINSNDSITISFTSAPPIDGAEISIISAIAYTSASDQSYLRIG